MELTQARVRELFDYQDGKLFWTMPKKGRQMDRPVGCISRTKTNAYLISMIDGHSYKVHRLVFLWHHGYLPVEVDHEDTNGLNNRIENLRPASSSDQKANKSKNSNNTSGYKGVTWDKRREKWIAQIVVNYKHMYIGQFDTPESAHKAYEAAAIKYFGEFARAA